MSTWSTIALNETALNLKWADNEVIKCQTRLQLTNSRQFVYTGTESSLQRMRSLFLEARENRQWAKSWTPSFTLSNRQISQKPLISQNLHITLERTCWLFETWPLDRIRMAGITFIWLWNGSTLDIWNSTDSHFPCQKLRKNIHFYKIGRLYNTIKNTEQ